MNLDDEHKHGMPFDPSPRLQGELINLRPLQAEDYDALFEAAADPLIWEQHPDHNRHRPDHFQRFFAGALQSGALVVIDNATGRSSAHRDFTDTTRTRAKSRSVGRFWLGRTGAASTTESSSD